MPPRRFAPLGHCMYCLATEGPLSEEHLVPRCLGGRWTLRDAVCTTCQVTTGQPEQATLASDFLIPKTLLALKRRRARARGPRHLVTPTPGDGVQAAGGRPSSPLTADRYPRSFQLPAFAPAGLLAGIDRSSSAPAIAAVHGRLALGTIREEIPAPPCPLADPLAYGYAIAKWAFAIAVAERGLPDCDTTAIRALLTRRRSDVFAFVGTPDPTPPADRRWLHSASLRDVGGWRVVRLNLLGSAGVPPYEVAMGPLTRR